MQAFSFAAKRRRPAAGRVWLCALLGLATWRGPLPCWHQHAMDFDARLGDRELARHVRVYHPRAPESARREWHFHLLTPLAAPCGGSEHELPELPPDPLTADGALVACASLLGGVLAASLQSERLPQAAWDRLLVEPAVAIPRGVRTAGDGVGGGCRCPGRWEGVAWRAASGVALC